MIRNLSTAGIIATLVWIGVAPTLVSLDFLHGLPGVDLWYALSVGAGVLALFAMTGTLALATRAPSVQAHIPHDTAIALHRALGTVVLSSAVLHGVAKGLAGIPPNASAIAMIVTATIGAALAARWMRASIEKRRWTYDRHKRVHAVTFGSMSFLLAVHLIESSFADGLSPAGVAIVGASVLVPVALALAARLRSVEASVVRVETAGSLAVLSLQPQRPYRYRGGQYAYLRLGRASHPFSFLSTPSDETLRFAIRVVGPFTRRLMALQPGEQLRLSAPLGSFGWSRTDRRGKRQNRACLLATGTGCAPILSVARDPVWQEAHPSSVVVLALATSDEIDAISEIAELHSASTAQVHVIDRSRAKQRIDEALIDEVTSDSDTWTFHLCASEAIARQIEAAIEASGRLSAGIHRERFSFAQPASLPEVST